MSSKKVVDPSKLKQVAEGKTKIIYKIDGTDLVVIKSKDKITAFNAVRANELVGKAAVSNLTTSLVFQYLNAVGLKTHFVSMHSESEFIAQSCAMVPIEWVTRRIATGSFLKRNAGVREGYRFAPVKLEIFYKDDAQNDPQWSEEMLIEAGITVGNVKIGPKEVELMSQVTVTVFEVLERAWATRGCTLVDMKVEYGVDSHGNILLADVIDSDSWRLWPLGDRRLQVDKQFYRDLPEVTEAALKELKQKFEWTSVQLQGFFTHPRGRVIILMGSAADLEFCKKIVQAGHKYGISCDMRVTSAHKGTEGTLNVVAEYEGDGIPTVFITVAGGSNGLGPVVSGNTCYPVINCPPIQPDKWGNEDIWSSLRVPSGLGCTTVLTPDCAALAAANILSLHDHVIWSRLRIRKLLNNILIYKGDKDATAASEQFHKESDVFKFGEVTKTLADLPGMKQEQK